MPQTLRVALPIGLVLSLVATQVVAQPLDLAVAVQQGNASAIGHGTASETALPRAHGVVRH